MYIYGYYHERYWAHLDVDDTDSFGPETITFTFTPEMLEGDGHLEYWVYNYAYRYSNSKTELSESEAVVKVYFGSELKKNILYSQK